MTTVLTTASCLLLSAGASRAVQMPDDGRSVHLAPSAHRGPVKEIRWGIADRGRRSVELDALVGYCEYGGRRPYVEGVKRRGWHGGLALTMLVRFPPQKSGGCMWVQVGVLKWVRLRRPTARTRLFDGSTSPPARRG